MSILESGIEESYTGWNRGILLTSKQVVLLNIKDSMMPHSQSLVVV